ncbi:MAG: hypothetical protein OEZ22_10570 [Spirochaetia bacterium]|nr:hypothetical protein [Spirochaetia bacterium]
MDFKKEHILFYLTQFYERIKNNKNIAAYIAAIILGLGTARLADAVAVYHISKETAQAELKIKNERPSMTRAPKAKTRTYDAAIVVGSPLFEKPVKVEEKVTETVEDVVEDKPFDLIGTLEGSAAFARAVILIKGSKDPSQEYGIGEKIGSAKIIEIGREYIRIRKDGQIIKVEVGETIEPNKITAAASASSDSTSGGSVIEKFISKEEIKRYLSDEAKIYQGASFGPKMEDGKIQGYKLHKLRPTHIFYTLGARAGDIVKAVNGHPLTDTERMFELWKTIKSAPPSELSIDLERKGSPLTYKFYVRN